MRERRLECHEAAEGVADEDRRQEARDQLDVREGLGRKRFVAEPGQVGRDDVVAVSAQERRLSFPHSRVGHAGMNQNDALIRQQRSLSFHRTKAQLSFGRTRAKRQFSRG